MEGKKRKISARKVLQVLTTLVLTTACTMALVSASKIENQKTLRTIDIDIKNGDKYRFIDKQDIMNEMVNNRNLDIKRLPMGNMDIHSMENIVASNPWVADAQLFIDNQHVLHVDVTQRVPVARIFESDGNSYYLDPSLSAMPLSDKYVYYTTVVTNVPPMHNDSASKSMKAQIVSLVRYIESDKFWNAQISEITIDSAMGFELIPVLGGQKIILGDTSAMKDKFANLFAFYKNVLNRIGWDRYEVLDLRYKGQVVASPSLPYKGPVDKAMSNMNWVKSIIGTAPEEKDTANKIVATIAKAKVVANIAKPATTASTKQTAVAQKPAAKTAGTSERKAQAIPNAAPKKTIAAPKQDKKTAVTKANEHKTLNPKQPVKDDKTKDNKKPQKKGKDDKQPKPKYVYPGSNNH